MLLWNDFHLDKQMFKFLQSNQTLLWHGPANFTWDGCQSALVVHGDLHRCRSIMHIGSQGNHDSCNPGVQEWNLWLKWQYYDSPVDWKKAIPELLGLLNDDNDVLYFLEHLFMNDLDLKRLFLRDLRLSKYIFLAIEHFLTCQVLFHVLKKMYLPSPQRKCHLLSIVPKNRLTIKGL